MRTLVHVTHEAVQKVGGIGAVLQGLITSKAYNQQIDRTVLIGPLFTREGSVNSRLGPDGEVFYSSVDGLLNHPTAPMWEEIERAFKVDIVYGRRTFHDDASSFKATAEVVLVDVTRRELLVQEAELLEQRILVRLVVGGRVVSRRLPVSDGQLLGLALLLAELSLTLLVGLWASSQSERLLRRL